jgi:hypothetical protein
MEEQWARGLAIRWQGRRCTDALLGLVPTFDYFIVASGNIGSIEDKITSVILSLIVETHYFIILTYS